MIFVNCFQNLYMQSSLQTHRFPVHALSMYKHSDEPRNIPLNWQIQVEDSCVFSTERSLLKKIYWLQFILIFMWWSAEVAKHRTVCDATEGCAWIAATGRQSGCAEKMSRFECVCTERMKFTSMCATERVKYSLLLMCSVDNQTILWMLFRLHHSYHSHAEYGLLYIKY